MELANDISITSVKLRVPVASEGGINVRLLLIEQGIIKEGDEFSLRIRALHDDNPHYDIKMIKINEVMKFQSRCPQIDCPLQLTIDIG